jgi:hypothetical protein
MNQTRDNPERDDDERPSDQRRAADGPGNAGPGEAGPGDQRGGVTFWQVVSSTLAAAFGVQSSRNRERDFTHGKPLHFIIAGIIFTVLFVVAMVVIVNLVLSGAR